MITTSKSFITDSGRETIWTLPSTVVVDRMNSCLRLNDEYQKAFHDAKRLLDAADSDRRFDFPEMLIFGKLEKFRRRVENIVEMFHTIDTYSKLQNSNIEGKANAWPSVFYPLHFNRLMFLALLGWSAWRHRTYSLNFSGRSTL